MALFKNLGAGVGSRRRAARLAGLALAGSWLGASLFSCAHATQGNGGGGAGGGNGSPVTSTGNLVPTSKSSTGTAMGGKCDTGVFGSLLDTATQAQQDVCIACVKCSQTDTCTAPWQSYGASPDYQAYADCNQACMSGDTACTTQCTTLYPSADAAFQTAVSCSICQECIQNCDAANTCM